MAETDDNLEAIRAQVKDVRAEIASYLYEAQGLGGPVRPLLAPGTRGVIDLSTLRRLCAVLGIKPHLCPGDVCPTCDEPEVSRG